MLSVNVDLFLLLIGHVIVKKFNCFPGNTSMRWKVGNTHRRLNNSIIVLLFICFYNGFRINALALYTARKLLKKPIIFFCTRHKQHKLV